MVKRTLLTLGLGLGLAGGVRTATHAGPPVQAHPAAGQVAAAPALIESGKPPVDAPDTTEAATPTPPTPFSVGALAGGAAESIYPRAARP